jgi:Ras-related protein Rab-11A
MDEDIDLLIKVVIVGDSSVGKTNLLSRFAHNSFNENSRNTIGVDFQAVDLNISGQNIKAQFWDTAGQEKYRSIAAAYYKNAQGIIITYDVTREQTFKNVQFWYEELREQGEPDVEIILIGNKVDLEAQRKVTGEQGAQLAKEKGMFFMETSAKTNQDACVEKAFTVLLEEIVRKTEDRMKESKVHEIGEGALDARRNRTNEGPEEGQRNEGFCC